MGWTPECQLTLKTADVVKNIDAQLQLSVHLHIDIGFRTQAGLAKVVALLDLTVEFH